jgi:hypothetical protein
MVEPVERKGVDLLEFGICNISIYFGSIVSGDIEVGIYVWQGAFTEVILLGFEI